MALLLLCSAVQTSPMAHDEGWYATLAQGLVKSGDWLTPHWWGAMVYDKTSGLHWLIALAYSGFGISLGSARLPSFLACILSVLLTYEIGCILLNRTAAWWGAMVLTVGFLWVQYGQLATQDLPLVAVELLAIWAILQAEQYPDWRVSWLTLAGSLVGVGFLVKGVMVFLPALALVPYLVIRKHLLNPGLYLGLGAGLSLVAVWFWQLEARHGMAPFEQLFGMVKLTSTGDYHNVGPFYYLWNIPANAFPWPFFALLGTYWVSQDRTLTRRWLLLGYPVILFVALTLFPTRTQYYALQLHPFLALLAGVALVHLADRRKTWLPVALSYGFGGLGMVLVGGSLLLLSPWLEIGEDTRYGFLALVLGLSWLFFGWLGLIRANPRWWLGSLLLGPWLSLALAGATGGLGNYSPDVRTATAQPEVSQILQTHPVQMVVADPVSGEDHKTWILLSFYSPSWGKRYPDCMALPPASYAWVSPGLLVPSSFRQITTVRGWRLVQADGSGGARLKL